MEKTVLEEKEMRLISLSLRINVPDTCQTRQGYKIHLLPVPLLCPVCVSHSQQEVEVLSQACWLTGLFPFPQLRKKLKCLCLFILEFSLGFPFVFQLNDKNVFHLEQQ